MNGNEFTSIPCAEIMLTILVSNFQYNRLANYIISFYIMAT